MIPLPAFAADALGRPLHAADDLATVQVTLEAERVERFEAEMVLRGGWQEPDYDKQPNAVRVSRRIVVRFGIGPLSRRPRMSKVLSGWGRMAADVTDPTEADWAAAEVVARRDLAALLDRHGFAPGKEQTNG